VNSLKWITFFSYFESETAIKIGQKLDDVIKIMANQVLIYYNSFFRKLDR